MTARHFNDAQPIVVRMSQPSSCGVASEINAKLFRSNWLLCRVYCKVSTIYVKYSWSRLTHAISGIILDSPIMLYSSFLSLSPSFSLAWLFVFESSYENNSCLVLSHACIHIKFDLPRDSILVLVWKHRFMCRSWISYAVAPADKRTFVLNLSNDFFPSTSTYSRSVIGAKWNPNMLINISTSPILHRSISCQIFLTCH